MLEILKKLLPEIDGDSSIFNMNNHKNRITDMENMGVIQDGKTRGFYAHVNIGLCPEIQTIVGLAAYIMLESVPRKKNNQ